MSNETQHCDCPVKQYYQVGSMVGAKLNAIQPEVVAPVPVADVYTLDRIANGGGASDPSLATVQHNGNPRIVPDSGNGAIDTVAHTVDFFRIPVATTFVAGDSVDLQIFASIAQTGGTAPAFGAPLAQQIRYVDTFGNTQVLLANLVLVAPGNPTLHVADVQINMVGTLPVDFADFLDFSITYAVPQGAAVSFSYYINPPAVPSELPVWLQITYNVVPDPAVVVTLLYNGEVNMLFQTFPAGADPIASGGAIAITGVFSAASGNFPIDGVLYKFPNPFFLAGVATIDADDHVDMQDNTLQDTYSNLILIELKRALDEANIEGLSDDPPSITLIKYVKGRFSRYLAHFINNQSEPAIWFPALMSEQIMADHWQNEFVAAAAADVNALRFTDIAKNMFSHSDKNIWGAPGWYFVPTGVGSIGEDLDLDAFETAEAQYPTLVTMELESIS